jgi:hypothetical protein
VRTRLEARMDNSDLDNRLTGLRSFQDIRLGKARLGPASNLRRKVRLNSPGVQVRAAVGSRGRLLIAARSPGECSLHPGAARMPRGSGHCALTS